MRWGDGSCNLLRCKFFVLLVLVGCSDGYLNIFISQSEVMKLLGEYVLPFFLCSTGCACFGDGCFETKTCYFLDCLRKNVDKSVWGNRLLKSAGK
ncbi:hypothetical protein WH47_03101 [Habropoda laboriosa]|uniref:Uncharacterized protein n=1 Tax=Habropoda laboriosa TaxID=597456 RepID=A0A0L7QJQ5_9HYME|nr:hypothetical protein WH47_03101 [Habropoda laboriosa]